MGLDNGICFAEPQIDRQVPRHVELFMGEICYWRKCYSLRNSIINAIADYEHSDGEDYELTAEDVIEIINILRHYDNKDVWNNTDSIWDYDNASIHEMFRYQIHNLKWLVRYMKKHPDDKVVFYDSF